MVKSEAGGTIPSLSPEILERAAARPLEHEQLCKEQEHPASPQLAHPIPGLWQGAPQALLPSPVLPRLLGLTLG